MGRRRGGGVSRDKRFLDFYRGFRMFFLLFCFTYLSFKFGFRSCFNSVIVQSEYNGAMFEVPVKKGTKSPEGEKV